MPSGPSVCSMEATGRCARWPGAIRRCTRRWRRTLTRSLGPLPSRSGGRSTATMPAVSTGSTAANRRESAPGRDVLIEKPVSPDPLEIDRLISVARSTGRVAMPAHNYAYTPEFQRIKRLVDDGSLGNVRGVWVTYALKHPESVASAYGGVLED